MMQQKGPLGHRHARKQEGTMLSSDEAAERGPAIVYQEHRLYSRATEHTLLGREENVAYFYTDRFTLTGGARSVVVRRLF